MVHSNRGSSHSLDRVCASIPSLEPEFIVLTTRIPAHVEEQARQLIGQHQHALWSRLQENGETLDCSVRNVKPRRHEWPRIRRSCWHHRLRSNFLTILVQRYD